MRLSVLSLACALLAACATTPDAEVTRFHTLGPANGQTFAIVAANEERGGSLAFAQFAGDISARLQQHGYVPVAEGGTPDMMVLVDYGSGAEVVQQPRSRVSVGIGVGHGGYHHGPYGGTGVGMSVGTSLGEETRVSRRHGLSLVMENLSGERQYEGKAELVARGVVEDYLPALIHALFANFPGNSGVTETITPPDLSNTQ